MRSQALLIAVVLSVGCSGCDADFQPGSRITKLRLLAARADAPYAQPEQSVALEPLLAAASPELVSWATATCTDPSAATIEGCLAELDAPFRAFDPQLTPLSVQVGLASAYERSGQLGVMLIACPGTIDTGMTERVPVVCRNTAGDALALQQFEVGMKRIYVSKSARNDNPSITALTWDGEPWPQDELQVATACTEKTDTFDDCPEPLRHRIGIRTTAAESGTDDAGASFQEQQVVQVYATQGVFEYQVRIASDADNSWVAQRSDDSELATLWFVVRDDRGGVGWERRQVRVR